MNEEKEISLEVLVPVRRNESLPYLLELQIPAPRPKTNQTQPIKNTAIPSPEPITPAVKVAEKKGFGQAFQGLFGQTNPKAPKEAVSPAIEKKENQQKPEAKPEAEQKTEMKNDSIRKLFLR